MIKRAIFLVAFCFSQLSCGNSALPGDVGASSECFGGWISERGNTDPTGYCAEDRNEKEELRSRIEIDFPSQRLYIHGALRNFETQTTSWFRFKATSCTDNAEGWTVVKGTNLSTGEKYVLKHRETENSETVVKGEAELYVELGGNAYKTTLACKRSIN